MSLEFGLVWPGSEIGWPVRTPRDFPRESMGYYWSYQPSAEALLENDLLPSLKASNPDGPVLCDYAKDFDEERFVVRILRARCYECWCPPKKSERIKKRIWGGALSDSIDPGLRE